MIIPTTEHFLILQQQTSECFAGIYVMDREKVGHHWKRLHHL